LVGVILVALIFNGTGISIVFAQEQTIDDTSGAQESQTQTSEEVVPQSEEPASQDEPPVDEAPVDQQETSTDTTPTSEPEAEVVGGEEESLDNEATPELQDGGGNNGSTSSGESLIANEQTEQVEDSTLVEDVTEGLPGLEGVVEPGTTSLLITGDATALAAIFNLVNTSFVNSEGAIIALSNSSIPLDSIDTRPSFDDATSSQQTSCDIQDCTLSIVNQNQAEVLNTVSIVAATGGNVAESGTDAIIHTGDAYALASLFNLVNATFVGSNYMIISLNHIGSWNGDVVLPSEDALNIPTDTLGGVISNTNEALVDGTVSASADTGENEALVEGEGTASIETGDAEAFASVFNLINTNVINTSFVYLLFNVAGSYSGNLFGLPAWITVEPRDNGFLLWGSPDASMQGGWQAMVENANTASIINNISSAATTGNNTATTEDGSASINTGDALAITSIANIANINVLGSNWLLGIFNIAGDWDGDVSFGRPDLWVGQRIEVSRTPARPSDEVVDHITIKNMGDSRANQVQLIVQLQQNWLQISSASNGGSIEGGEVLWDIGGLAPGQSIEVSYTGSVVGSIPTGTSHLVSDAEGSALETDEDIANNHDSVSLEVYRSPPPRAVLAEEALEEEEELPEEEAPRLIVEKTNDATGPVVAGQEVTYTVRVINKGTVVAHNTTVRDVLLAQTGLQVSEQTINLGDVMPEEEVVINYTVSFTDAMSGLFSNRATVVEGTGLSTSSATSTVEVVEDEIMGDDPIIEIADDVTTPEAPTRFSSLTVERSTDEEGVNQEDVPPFGPSSLQANLSGVLNAALGFWRWLLVATILLLIFFIPTIRRTGEESP